MLPRTKFTSQWVDCILKRQTDECRSKVIDIYESSHFGYITILKFGVRKKFRHRFSTPHKLSQKPLNCAMETSWLHEVAGVCRWLAVDDQPEIQSSPSALRQSNQRQCKSNTARVKTMVRTAWGTLNCNADCTQMPLRSKTVGTSSWPRGKK